MKDQLMQRSVPFGGGYCTGSRESWADYLRAFACLAVIVIHVSAYYWDTLNVYSFDYIICTLFEGLSRWAVPVFVMISGAFILQSDKCMTFDYLCRKIVRIFIAFLIWSAFYATLRVIKDVLLESNPRWTIGKFLGEVAVGHYHMWFCYLIIGLYIATPIFKLIVNNEKICVYFIVLSVIFNFGINGLLFYCNSKILTDILGNLDFNITSGYVGYFLLGYYLKTHRLSRGKNCVMYFLGVLGTVVNVFFTLAFSLIQNHPIGIWRYISLNVLCQSLGIFCLLKNWQPQKRMRKHDFLNSVVRSISEYSFGIYLAHVFWLEITEFVFSKLPHISQIIRIPVVTIVVFVLGFATTVVVRKIPRIGKYIT